MEAIIRITDDGDEGVDVQQVAGTAVTESAAPDEFAMPEEGGASVSTPPVQFQSANAPDHLGSDVARSPRRFQGSNSR